MRALKRITWSVVALVFTFNLAEAAPLEPSKGSEVVTLAGLNTCDGGDGFLFNKRITADGALVDFVIPAKTVLVITDVQFAFSGGSPASSDIAILTLSGSFPVPVAQATFVFTDGRGAGTIATKVVARSGQTICLSHTSGQAAIAPFIANLHGFFAKDK